MSYSLLFVSVNQQLHPHLPVKHHFDATLVIGLCLCSCNNIAINTDSRFEKETMT